jgi:hypothetical protein
MYKINQHLFWASLTGALENGVIGQKARKTQEEERHLLSCLGRRQTGQSRSNTKQNNHCAVSTLSRSLIATI